MHKTISGLLIQTSIRNLFTHCTVTFRFFFIFSLVVSNQNVAFKTDVGNFLLPPTLTLINCIVVRSICYSLYITWVLPTSWLMWMTCLFPGSTEEYGGSRWEPYKKLSSESSCFLPEHSYYPFLHSSFNPLSPTPWTTKPIHFWFTLSVTHCS
jgi:hypothetical protein